MVVNLGVHSGGITAAASSKYSISNWLGINSSEGKYEAQIGKTLEGNGTKLVLNEFFADNSRIVINLTINKENVKVVFSDLAKECNASASEVTYNFVYDSQVIKTLPERLRLIKI